MHGLSALSLLLFGLIAVCSAQVAPWFKFVFPTDPVYNSVSAGSLLGNLDVQTPVPRPLVSKLDDWVAVEDYGAVGDCVTNDTVALQLAFNSLAAGRTLILSRCYSVGQLTFNITNGTLLGVGGGVLSSLLPTAAVTTHQPPTLLTILSGGVSVRDLRFANPSDANNTAALWFRSAPLYPVVTGCTIDNFAHAIDIGEGLNLPINYALGGQVTSNIITNVKGPTDNSNDWGDCVHLWCYGCLVSGNECFAKAGLFARCGFAADNQGDSYGKVGGNSFSGNTVHSGFRRGFDIEAKGCSVVGNRVNNALTWGIFALASAPLISSNVIYQDGNGTASRAIYLTGSDEAVISNNQIQTSGSGQIGEAIDLEATDTPINHNIGAIVSGNTLSGTFSRCFRIRSGVTLASFIGNSCFTNQPAAVGQPTAGAFLDASSTNIQFFNNLFNISASGGGYGIYLANSTSVVNVWANQFFGTPSPTPFYQLNYIITPSGTIGSDLEFKTDGHDSNPGLKWTTKGLGEVWVNAGGNMRVGPGTALPTSSTVGFFAIATTAGTPTGVPNGAGAGVAPMVVDSTATKLWIYVNSGWHFVTLT